MFWFFLPHLLAQEHPAETIDGTIIVEDSKDPTEHQGSSLELDLQDQKSTDNLGAILQQVSGTYTRNLGGLGAYSTVSIRGASTQQTLITLDGIPLNPDGVSTVNLSEIPIQAFSKIQVYRSNAPLYLQNGNIGGVINVQSSQEMQPQLDIGIGSFQSGLSHFLLPFTKNEAKGFFFGQLFHTQGNYSFYQDQATPFNTSDDTWEIRQGNQKNQGNILSSITMKNTQILWHSVLRNEGVPGNRNALTPDITLQSQRHFLAGQWQVNSEHTQHHLQSWGHFQTEELQDDLGQMGLGPFSSLWHFSNISLRSFHQGLGNDNALSFLGFPSLGLSLRWEEATTQSANPPEVHQRIFLQSQLGNTTFLGRDWEWQNSIQGHALLTAENIYQLTPKSTLLYMPNKTAKYWLTWMRGFRPPDFTELYGNRGAIVGNSDLRPETANTIDMGVAYQTPLQQWHIQIGGFLRQSQNEIIFVQNAQKQSLPINFESTQVQGVEINHSWNLLPHANSIDFLFQQNFTWMHSRNLSPIASLQGKQLPNVPTWNVYQSLQLQHSFWQIQGSWIFVDGNYWDATNYQKSPARSLFNADISLKYQQWILEVDANNFLNTQTQKNWIDPLQPELGKREYALEDFLGYPLPSRQVFFTLKWQPAKDPQ